MKVISMYLPQFHRVKENDKWWGNGFTEWTAVKQAEPLFDGHYQPHIPLNDNYYDLLDKETMCWQADLMKRYKIDGQCIYHYWFKDGRQILEKPVENLLKWTDIDMPFCFCWANQSWARTWSRLRNYTPWSTELEPEQKKGDDGLLLEQQYGTEVQWKQHFEYLLPFFKDERYIKIDGKPVFVIYNTPEIYCLKDMMMLWKGLAEKAGFPGIFLIGGNDHGTSNVLDLSLSFEPMNAIKQLMDDLKDRTGVCRFSFDVVWKEILDYQISEDKVSVQGFVGRDDTPRRGRNGQVVEGADPERFREYLSELIAKNVSNGCEITFINAWNEWGEGMHLEPDIKNGYGFLEAIPYAKEHYLGYMGKNDHVSPIGDMKEIRHLKRVNERYRSYWTILDTWLTLKERGAKLEEILLQKGIHSISIYGIGLLGKHLYYELENSEIEIKGIIDRGAYFNKENVILYRPEDKLPAVDKIVVTATYAYSEIAEQLSRKGYENVISLEEIIS